MEGPNAVTVCKININTKQVAMKRATFCLIYLKMLIYLPMMISVASEPSIASWSIKLNVQKERQCTYVQLNKLTLRSLRLTSYVMEKQYVFQVLSACAHACVYALLQLLSSMQRGFAIFSSVASPTLQYFPIISYKRHDFQGGGGSYWTKNVCFGFL